MKPLEMREVEDTPRLSPAIRVADASDEILAGVRDVFGVIIFGEGYCDYGDTHLRLIKGSLNERYAEFKFGGGAKFEIREGATRGYGDGVAVFSLYPNIGRNEPGYKEGELRAETFRQKTVELFSAKGVLVMPPRA